MGKPNPSESETLFFKALAVTPEPLKLENNFQRADKENSSFRNPEPEGCWKGLALPDRT